MLLKFGDLVRELAGEVLRLAEVGVEVVKLGLLDLDLFVEHGNAAGGLFGLAGMAERYLCGSWSFQRPSPLVMAWSWFCS
jgi:hypothetical protein